jgi:phage tail protein X
MLKKLLLSVAALALSASAVLAQGVNQVPQVGAISTIYRNPTYTASSVALVPAASATDIFCISPGTAKNISIRRIAIAGTAGTAVATPFLIYRRVSLDTGGTAATSLALPVAVPLSPADPASNATLTAYTANPTIVDSSPSLMQSMMVDLPVTTAAGGDIANVRTWGTSVDMFSKGLDLQKNTTQQICINLNAVSVSSGVLSINMEWQEAP